MEKTTSITKLACALLKFQAAAIKITKDATNPYFKSRYATLSNILDDIQPHLTNAGLAVTQLPEGSEKLITLLIHAESGEYLQSEYDTSPAQKTPQAIGSAITYARRYALCAILGLNIEDDDDGNAASGKQESNGQQQGNGRAANNKSSSKAQDQQQSQTQGTQQQPNNKPTEFQKAYPDGKSLLAVLATVKDKQQLTDLYNANEPNIKKYPNIKDQFTAKKNEVYGRPQDPYILKYEDQDTMQALLIKGTSEQVTALHRNNSFIIERTPELFNAMTARLAELKNQKTK